MMRISEEYDVMRVLEEYNGDFRRGKRRKYWGNRMMSIEAAAQWRVLGSMRIAEDYDENV